MSLNTDTLYTGEESPDVACWKWVYIDCSMRGKGSGGSVMYPRPVDSLLLDVNIKLIFSILE